MLMDNLSSFAPASTSARLVPESVNITLLAPPESTASDSVNVAARLTVPLSAVLRSTVGPSAEPFTITVTF